MKNVTYNKNVYVERIASGKNQCAIYFQYKHL